MWWLAFFLLLVAGWALLALANRWQEATGAVGARLVSVDLERDGRPAPTMVDDGLGLTGRPDLLLEARSGWIPVEIKSGKAPVTPHLSHMLQLAAYCRLAEATYGRRPRNGILRYADRAFSLPYTRALERDLLLAVGRIRAQAGRIPGRSHNDPVRCAACGYSSVCDQRLGASGGGEGGWL